MKRVIFILLGLIMLTTVMVLGVNATIKPVFVLWFGLSAALLVSPAFLLFGKAVRASDQSDDEEPAGPASLPRIIDDVKRAETEEDKIAIIEAEARKLDMTLQGVTRRRILQVTQSRLEKELEVKIAEYNNVVSELQKFNEKVENSSVREDVYRVEKMLEMREQGRVIKIKFGRRVHAYPVCKFGNDLLSSALLVMLAGIEKMQIKKPKPVADEGTVDYTGDNSAG